LIFIKKIIKSKFIFKKTETEPKPVQTDGFGSVRFFKEKTGSNRFGSVLSGLARFFLFFLFGFGLVRFFKEKTGSNRFGSVLSGLARFFLVFFVWVRFGSVFSVSGL
jgi:hypothetical protein